MKILIDVNLAQSWAECLKSRGFNAVHWRTIGRADATDTEIVSYALQNGYAIFTRDLDFSAILAAAQTSAPSVAQLRTDDARPELYIDRVAAALAAFSADIERGALVTVDLQKARVRLLPLIS